MVSPLILILGFQGMPPSRLGFVCKPDMPPHINILFRARPPMNWTPIPDKFKCRDYEGVIGNVSNILERFEKNPPPERTILESKRTKKLKSILENIEKTKAMNYEKLKECKYNIRYLSVRGYLTILFLTL